VVVVFREGPTADRQMMGGWMDGWMDGLENDGWVEDEWVDGWMDGWIGE
jgi:hypothetical protein